MLDADALLALYDSRLRGEAEVVSALRVSRHGPLVWATYVGGRGFAVYPPLQADAAYLTDLVDATITHYRDVEDGIIEVEWKARGHDQIPDLDEVLRRGGFRPDEPESVMMGEAVALAVDVPVPEGVTIRRVTSEPDVRRMCAMQAQVFDSDDQSEPILHRLSLGHDDLELWVAEVGDAVVSAGRLEPMAGTEVAGIWGGCTRSEWRGRGIYRALTAERARSALRRGCTILHSDSTEGSRPILQRAGFLRITTTTPYLWRG